MSNRFIPPEKLSYGTLALLDWLCERGEGQRMVATSSGMGRASSTLIQVDAERGRGLDYLHPHSDAALLDRLGGRDVTDLRTLAGYGLHWFQRSMMEGSAARDRRPDPNPAVEAILARHGREAFDYTDNVYFASAETMRLWREGASAEAARRREARAEAEAASRRLVLVKGRFHEDNPVPPGIAAKLGPRFRFPYAGRTLDQPYALVEVRKETEGRIYVSRVEYLGAGGGNFGGQVVMGRKPNLYVERDSVMADGVTREQALEIQRIYRVDAEERAEARAKLLSEIEGALVNWSQRQVQKDAERQDLLDEVLGRSGGPAPGR